MAARQEDAEVEIAEKRAQVTYAKFRRSWERLFSLGPNDLMVENEGGRG